MDVDAEMQSTRTSRVQRIHQISLKTLCAYTLHFSMSLYKRHNTQPENRGLATSVVVSNRLTCLFILSNRLYFRSVSHRKNSKVVFIFYYWTNILCTYIGLFSFELCFFWCIRCPIQVLPTEKPLNSSITHSSCLHGGSQTRRTDHHWAGTKWPEHQAALGTRGSCCSQGGGGFLARFFFSSEFFSELTCLVDEMLLYGVSKTPLQY